MSETCLKLVFPQTLEEAIIDHLLAHPEWVARFVTYAVDGHGAPGSIDSAAEQVRGRAHRIAVETLIRHDAAVALIDHLRQELAGADVTWWLSPVIASGSFA